MMKAQIARLSSSYRTLISVISGVTALVVLLSDGAKNLIEASLLIPEELRPFAKWIVIGILVLVGLVTFLQALARRSILVLKSRFQISPRDPAHLIGREDDLRRLAIECSQASTSLVFLTGESGAGKSALVQAGLVEYLQCNSYWTQSPRSLPAPPNLLPIVLDGAAIDDWRLGIENVLRRVLPTHADECRKREIPPYTCTQSPFEWLRSIHANPNHRVLLILDQMDDYITMHREHLFAEGKVISAAKLLKANKPWKELADLVREHQICLLLICRADAAMYLEAFRFVDPETPVIFRLHQEILLPLLDAITLPGDDMSPVITDPNHGWLQLRPRLLRDLADGAAEILPIRLVVALSSLRTFRFLTPGEYQKAGRAAGLERLHIETVIRRASQASGLSVERLLHLIESLISSDASKTQRRSIQEMASNAKVEFAALKRALQYIEGEHLIRRIPGDEGCDSFMLYHDQLARGIRDASRARDHWNILLRERAKNHTDAIGWYSRWKTLLSLREQISVFWHRLRGRLHYRPHLGFALLSTSRCLLPLAACSLFSLVALEYQQSSLERKVETVVGELVAQVTSLSSTVANSDRVEGWHSFATLPDPARLHGLQFILANASLSNSFRNHHEQLAHVVFGLDPSSSFLEVACKTFISAPDYASALMADMSSRLPWTTDCRRLVVSNIIERIVRCSDRYKLTQLTQALSCLIRRISDKNEDVKAWAENLVRCMSKPDADYGSLLNLAEVIETLGARLPEGDSAVRKATAILIEHLVNAKTDNDELLRLAQMLGKLIYRLPQGDADVKLWATMLVRRMGEPQIDRAILSSLGFALTSLADRLPKGDADLNKWSSALIGYMGDEKTDAASVSALGMALRSLTSQMPEGGVNLSGAVTHLVKRITKVDERHYPVMVIALALVTLVPKDASGDFEMKNAVGGLVQHMISPGIEPSDLLSMASVVGLLFDRSVKVDEDVKSWCSALADYMSLSQTDCASLPALSHALCALSSGRPDCSSEIKRALIAILKRMRMVKPNDSSLYSFCEALSKLCSQLSENDLEVKECAVALTSRMASPETDNDAFSNLGDALSTLAIRLTKDDPDVRKGFEALTQRIIKPDLDSYELEKLAGTLVLLAARVPNGEEQLKKAIMVVMNHMIRSEIFHSLQPRLAIRLRDLIKYLPKDNVDAKKWSESLVDKISKPGTTRNVQLMIANILVLLAEGGHLSPSNAEHVTDVLWSSLQRNADSNEINAWCRLEPFSTREDRRGVDRRVQPYLKVLKHPQTVGEGRNHVIRALAKIVDEDFTVKGEFTPDIWMVVEWGRKMAAKGWHLSLR